MGVLLPLYGDFSVVAMKDTISKQIEENILRYKIPVYINIHKKHYFNVCVPAQ